jgi:GNAT superfamily N-acetyltransferase
MTYQQKIDFFRTNVHPVEASATTKIARLACERGVPGIKKYDLQDSVLYVHRDDSGVLTGWLTYFLRGYLCPRDGQTKSGDFKIYVSPAYRRAGVGTKLLAKAVPEMRINLFAQDFTPEGFALALKFLGCQFDMDEIRKRAAATKNRTLRIVRVSADDPRALARLEEGVA